MPELQDKIADLRKAVESNGSDLSASQKKILRTVHNSLVTWHAPFAFEPPHTHTHTHTHAAAAAHTRAYTPTHARCSSRVCGGIGFQITLA